MAYWIAHVRGGDFAKLKKLGFVTFYPAMDDYVFLEETDDNRKFLRKQDELGIHFVKARGAYALASNKELEKMRSTTSARIEVGTEIIVVAGYASNLEGKVLEIDGDNVRCNLNGLTRQYELTLNVLDVAEKK